MATARLYAILARKAPVAVIFRRGPSKQVALVRWELDRDRFTVGQWLKARIYERRCDLSPSGDRLAYFAASWKGPHQSWTAVSRPPWLTALALWPKGDAWGGGALFASENVIELNHWPSQLTVAGRPPPKRIKVVQHPIAGRGEDWPIWTTRLVRDGWQLVQQGNAVENKARSPKIWFEYDPAVILGKPSPRQGGPRLEMRVKGIKELNGPWYVIDHAVVDGDGREELLADCEWADWDPHGDLLFVRGGAVFRASHRRLDDLSRAKMLIDLAPLTFEARVAPASARQW